MQPIEPSPCQTGTVISILSTHKNYWANNIFSVEGFQFDWYKMKLQKRNACLE